MVLPYSMPFRIAYPFLELLRTSRGETRSDIGRILGISHVHEKFAGYRLWTKKDLRRLARHFGYSLSDLRARVHYARFPSSTDEAADFITNKTHRYPE